MKSTWILVGALMGFALSSMAASIPYVPSGDDSTQEGFVRLINHSDVAGEISIVGFDDAGSEYGPITLDIDANKVVHLSSSDLEDGNTSKGLSGGFGSGEGDWRLETTTELNIQALGYIQNDIDFYVPMLRPVQAIGNRHRIATFEPASDDDPDGVLRVINPGEEEVNIAIEGIDSDGALSTVNLVIPAGRTLMLHAKDLESGEAPSSWPADTEISGSLGDGNGHWQLILTADNEISVLNLLSTSAGAISNLSGVSKLMWRGLEVTPEPRCKDLRYVRAEYGTRYRSLEDDIVDELGGIFGPYSGQCFSSTNQTDIEHIVAIHQGHYSGMCYEDIQTKRTFAGDILNLTIADPQVNQQKGSYDAFDWMPENNKCWFSNRVLQVKLKYEMTVDLEEAAALELVLADCESTAVVKPACATE